MSKEKIAIPEIIELMIKRQNVSKKSVDEFIRVLLSTIEDALLSGDSVRVKGLGVFRPQWNEAQISVDVNTGNEMIIPGFYRIVFSPENDLQLLINEPYAHLETIILSDSEPENEAAEITEVSNPSVDDELVNEKDISNLSFFSSQAAEIKEILSDINALSGKKKPALIEEPAISKKEEKAVEEIKQSELIKISDSEYDEEDYLDDIAIEEDKRTEEIIEAKEKIDEIKKEKEKHAEEEKIEEKDDDVVVEGDEYSVDAVVSVESTLYNDDFDVVRDVSLLYPSSESKAESKIVGDESFDAIIVSVDADLDISQDQVIDKDELTYHKNESDDKELVSSEAVSEIAEELEKVEEHEIEPESVIERAQEEVETSETELEDNYYEDEEVFEDEWEYDKSDGSDKTIIHSIVSPASDSTGIESSINRDISDKNESEEIKDSQIREFEELKIKKKNRILTTLYLTGSLLILGAAFYLSYPIINKMMAEKKSQERLDFIADSLANLRQVEMIKSIILPDSAKTSQKESTKNDSLSKISNAESEQSTSDERASIAVENKIQVKKESVNLYDEPRNYNSILATEKMVIGSQLTKFAKKYYGNATYWVYIYEANKDKISNPNNVPTGIDVKIPNMNSKLIDPQDKESLDYALRLQSKYLQ